jgi:hypothetical protein
VDTARTNLMSNFGFTEVQAQAILDMPLKRLAALERKRLQDEYRELLDRIAYLENLLAHPEKILQVIKEELLAIRAGYADARRTQIVERTKGTLTATDLLPDQKVLVTVGANGEVRRQDFSTATKTGLRQSGRDSAVALLVANTQDLLYLFDKKGQCCRLSIHELPQEEARHLADLTEFSRRDTVVAALALPRLTSDTAAGYLFAATRMGAVKRVALADFISAAAMNPEIIRVEGKDELGWVFLSPGNQEVILVSSDGYSIRFSEEEVRSMGLAAAGVAGMKLKKGEKLVSAQLADPEGELVTVTATGYTKRTPLRDYSSQGRNGSGIIAHKLEQRTGKLIDALVVNSERRDLVVFVTDKGGAKPHEISEIALLGRSTLGQKPSGSGRGDRIIAVKMIAGVPGFVGDDTLAPPPATGNGRGPSTQAKVTVAAEEDAIPVAENGRASRREVRPLRRKVEKPAAEKETPVKASAKPATKTETEASVKEPDKPATKPRAETPATDRAGRTKRSPAARPEVTPRTRKAGKVESRAADSDSEEKPSTKRNSAVKPESAPRASRASRAKTPAQDAKPAATPKDASVAGPRRASKAQAPVEDGAKKEKAAPTRKENGAASPRKARTATPTLPAESAPVQPELIPREEVEVKAAAVKKKGRSTKPGSRSKVDLVKSVTTAPKKKK